MQIEDEQSIYHAFTPLSINTNNRVNLELESTVCWRAATLALCSSATASEYPRGHSTVLASSFRPPLQSRDGSTVHCVGTLAEGSMKLQGMVLTNLFTA